MVIENGRVPGFDDFYLVKEKDGSLRALYSQFLNSCPLVVK